MPTDSTKCTEDTGGSSDREATHKDLDRCTTIFATRFNTLFREIKGNKLEISAKLSKDHDTLSHSLERYWQCSHSYSTHRRLQKSSVSKRLTQFLPKDLPCLDEEAVERTLQKLHYELMDESDSVETRNWEEIYELTESLRTSHEETTQKRIEQLTEELKGSREGQKGKKQGELTRLREDMSNGLHTRIEWPSCRCGTLDRPRVEIESKDYPLTLGQIARDYQTGFTQWLNSVKHDESGISASVTQNGGTHAKPNPQPASVHHPAVEMPPRTMSWSAVARSNSDKWDSSVLQFGLMQPVFRRRQPQRASTDPNDAWRPRHNASNILSSNVNVPDGDGDSLVWTAAEGNTTQDPGPMTSSLTLPSFTGQRFTTTVDTSPANARSRSVPAGPRVVMPVTPDWSLLRRLNDTKSGHTSICGRSDDQTSTGECSDSSVPCRPSTPPLQRGHQKQLSVIPGSPTADFNDTKASQGQTQLHVTGKADAKEVSTQNGRQSGRPRRRNRSRRSGGTSGSRSGRK